MSLKGVAGQTLTGFILMAVGGTRELRKGGNPYTLYVLRWENKEAQGACMAMTDTAIQETLISSACAPTVDPH